MHDGDVIVWSPTNCDGISALIVDWNRQPQRCASTLMITMPRNELEEAKLFRSL